MSVTVDVDAGGSVTVDVDDHASGSVAAETARAMAAEATKLEAPPGGSDGQVLTKDSTSATGNKWAPAGGAGGSDANFVFQQATPSASWTVTHNLAKRPCVDVVDASGNVVLADVQYLSDNALVVSFSAAIAGAAYVN